MPNFIHLPTELILAVISHLPRSNDKFYLLLVNRQLYHLIIPQLYKHIQLGQIGNPSNTDGFTRAYADSCWETVRLRRLTSVLENKHATHKLIVESLSLELNSNTLFESFAQSNITLYLPTLKSLYLNSKRPARLKWEQRSRYLSPAGIRERLRDVHETLESLIIELDQDVLYREGTGVGNFRYFKALKHLSIQSHVLLPEHKNHLGSIHGDDNVIGDNETILVKSFPETLQRLQISCWTDRVIGFERRWAHVIALLLRKMMIDLDLVPALQDVTVYYPINYDGEGDMNKEDKLNFRRCVAKGRWQAVGEMLTEVAFNQHREISVRFEQGSPKGSRAWGEIATEPSEAWSRE